MRQWQLTALAVRIVSQLVLSHELKVTKTGIHPVSTNWEATQTVTKFISHQIWANQSPKEHNYTVCALSMYSYLQQYWLGGAQHIVSMDSWVALHANSRFVSG